MFLDYIGGMFKGTTVFHHIKRELDFFLGRHLEEIPVISQKESQGGKSRSFVCTKKDMVLRE